MVIGLLIDMLGMT